MNPFQLSNLLYLTTVESINTITAHVRSLHATEMGPQAYHPLFEWPLLFLNQSIGFLYSEEEIQMNITAATIMNWHQSLPCHLYESWQIVLLSFWNNDIVHW